MKRFPESAHNKQLIDLPEGSRFALDYLTITGIPPANTVLGTVIDRGVGSVYIRLDAGLVLHSVMDRATGEEVGTLGKGRDRYTRWAPETKVVWLDEDPNNTNFTAGLLDGAEAEDEVVTTRKEAQPMAVVDQKKASSILARWDFQNKRYNAALQAGDAATAEQAEERMAVIMAEATEHGVELDPNPGVNLAEQDEPELEQEEAPAPAVAPIQLKVTKASKPVAKTNAAPVAVAPVVSKGEQLKKANAARLANLAAAKTTKGPKAAASAKAATPKAPKEPKPLNPCLDGCGAMVKGNFAMGHDAKLKSIILKVERGEVGQDAIPDVAQDLIKFRKSDVLEETVDGKKIRTQLFECTQSPVKLPGRAA